MPTDKGRTYEQERELIEALNFDAALRMFINRYSPEGEGPRNFEADLIHLVQRIYREAQAPFVKASADAIARTPMPPLFVQKVDDAMIGRALQSFDTGVGDPNDYRKRMRLALEAALQPLT